VVTESDSRAGQREIIHELRNMDEGADLEPILEQLVALPELPPGLSMSYGEEFVRRLPGIAGDLSLAPLRSSCL
jgi:hypothetical protein